MRLPFKTRFYGLVVLQLLTLAGLIAYKQATLLTGQRILLKTVPVDPRDMFRGDYVVLSYEISRLQSWQWREPSFERGATAYVTLRKQGRFWGAESVSKTAPGDQALFIRGRVTHTGPDAINLEYGIESYFVPEGKGRELERARGDRLAAEVAVDGTGRAAIRRLHVAPEAPRR